MNDIHYKFWRLKEGWILFWGFTWEFYHQKKGLVFLQGTPRQMKCQMKLFQLGGAGVPIVMGMISCKQVIEH